MTQDDIGLLESVLAALIRRAGGSVTITRDELDAAVESSATSDGRSEWLFDYNPSLDGTEVTVRAIAAPLRAGRAPGPAVTPVGGVDVPADRFAGVVLAALIAQDGGSVEIEIYRQMAQLMETDRPLRLRPMAGLDGGDHFTVVLAGSEVRARPTQHANAATSPPSALPPKQGVPDTEPNSDDA